MSEALPDRQSIRMKGWDYTTPGWYFVTICTKNMASCFGTIVKGHMVLNEVGKMLKQIWLSIEAYHPEYHLDEFVIMPNHVHGLVKILANRDDSGRRNGLPVQVGAGRCACPPGSLPEFMRRFKSLVVAEYVRGEKAGLYRPIAGKLWHRNYWDVIVRDEKALANIRNYIRFNPQNYEAVMQCGEPCALGNKGLLAMPKMGFLASRGESPQHGSLSLRKGEAIMSGFLSPMERKVFWAALGHRRPLIWVKPWSLEEGLDVPAIQAALAEGRLLSLSPFAEKEAPSVRRAAWCNEYVLAQCDRMVIGHLNPAGMLACILSEARADLEIEFMEERNNQT